MPAIRFSLRTLLVVVGFLGVALTALLRPSVWWALVVPGLLSLVIGLGVTKAICCEGKQRAYWASFVVTTLSYLALVALIQFHLQNIHGAFGVHSVWEEYLADPVWQYVHGKVPYQNTIINGRTRREVLSFLVVQHVVIALFIGSVSAWGALLCVRHLPTADEKSCQEPNRNSVSDGSA
jgi:hypothetical protein